jgi:hypothetical protein
MKENDYSKPRKTSPKKTFYCAMAEFYTNGTVLTATATRVCKEKPLNREGNNPIMRFSNIWFETEAEAAEHLSAVKALPAEGSAA